MKTTKLFLLAMLISIGINTMSQVAINKDGSAADGSAMLDVKSVDGGLLFPRLNTIQISGISSPAAGLMVFNTDSSKFYGFNGNKWISIWYRRDTLADWYCGFPITDARDGKTYNTVLIGGQCWMVENLAYLPSVSPSSYYGGARFYVYDYQGTDVAAAKATDNYQNYGVLYNWTASRMACPQGWHLPTDVQWTFLTDYLGGLSVAGGKMKSTRTDPDPHPRWNSPNTSATNSSGFSGLPGGIRLITGSFNHLGAFGYWWSSTGQSTTGAWDRYLKNSNYWASRTADQKGFGFSVRCIKYETSDNQPPGPPSSPNPVNGAADQSIEVDISWTCTDPEGDPLTYDIYFGTEAAPPQVATGQTATTYDPGTMANNTEYFWKIVAHDNHENTTEGPVWSFTTEVLWQCGDPIVDARDSQTYETVLIGSQCWMAENLNIGDRVDGQYDQISDGDIEKYCWDDDTLNCDNYGGLYQWAEMVQYFNNATNTTSWSPVPTGNVQGICPTGWHIPTDDEWKTLEMNLGMSQSDADALSWRGTDEGGKLKEVGTSHWFSPNAGATNFSGFTALPGGYRHSSGLFYHLGTDGDWWSSAEGSGTHAWHRYLGHGNDRVYRSLYTKTYGFSVRCLKN